MLRRLGKQQVEMIRKLSYNLMKEDNYLNIRKNNFQQLKEKLTSLD